VAAGDPKSWDARVSLALQARRNPAMTAVFWLLSWSGAGGVWFGLGGVLALAQRRGVELLPQQRSFLGGMLGAFAVLLAGAVIKRATNRPRPFMADIGVTAAVWVPRSPRSFPSTHAATSMCLATALLVAGHPLAGLVTLWAVGVSFSRLWLGVHYPSDVLGGTLLGVAFGLAPWHLVAQVGLG
jgi:undecaprenyl-diphosphatase